MYEQCFYLGSDIMPYLYKLKKLLIKLFTSFIFPEKLRKNVRNFLFYFSFVDFVRFKRQNFHIVSLGSDCLPRVLTTAVKLKPRKIYGEKTLPFDLCRSYDLKKIIKFIETDFKTYFDNLTISEELYPHDYKLSKIQFENRYKERIHNFLQILKSDKTIYFIYSNFEFVPDTKYIKKLYEVLRKKRQGKPFKLIILTSKHLEEIEDVIQITENFKIKHGNWVKSFINDYKDKQNEYTEFCSRAGGILKNIITKN